MSAVKGRKILVSDGTGFMFRNFIMEKMLDRIKKGVIIKNIICQL
jgi:hypothetical protein